MRALFTGSCAKEPDRPAGNEDAYVFSADRQRLALSDGASESYDSRIWARLLAGNYAENPQFDQAWLLSAISAYARQHDFANMSWSQQFSFERGCFATLLAAEHDATNRRLALFGVGDSVAVLFEGDSFAFAWPLDDAEQFRERPTLLSTLPEHNEFAQSLEFELVARLGVDLAAFRDPTLLCMTDALGEWTLRMAKDEPARLAEILAIRTEEQLATFVVTERAEKRMRIDDSTLAILKFDDGEDAVGLPQP
jgi:hypothetical protein